MKLSNVTLGERAPAVIIEALLDKHLARESDVSTLGPRPGPNIHIISWRDQNVSVNIQLLS